MYDGMQPDLMTLDLLEVDLPLERCAVPPDPDVEFATFVRARTGALLRTAYLLTGDRHLAEDLVQDALARAHRARHRLTADGHDRVGGVGRARSGHAFGEPAKVAGRLGRPLPGQ